MGFPALRGYGNGTAAAGTPARRGYAAQPVAHSSLATRGYGAGSTIAAVARRGYAGAPNLPISPPAGKQLVVVAGLPWVPPARSILEDAVPAVVNGDIIVCDQVSTPNGYAITMNADGTFSIATGTDSSRQSFQSDVYRLSTGTYYGAFTTWANNRIPVATVGLNLPTWIAGLAITPVDLAGYFSDPEADALGYSLVAGSFPNGVNLVGSVISGVPLTGGAFSATVRVTDITGEYLDTVISGSSLVGLIRFYNASVKAPNTILESDQDAGLEICVTVNDVFNQLYRNDLLNAIRAISYYLTLKAPWPPV
ncbi:MAG: hypothetical protein U1F35_05420 [Steroidobacteraceae bacterium]